jgi:hypothetical protein
MSRNPYLDPPGKCDMGTLSHRYLLPADTKKITLTHSHP